LFGGSAASSKPTEPSTFGAATTQAKPASAGGNLFGSDGASAKPEEKKGEAVPATPAPKDDPT
jgi:hypothetical protein